MLAARLENNFGVTRRRATIFFCVAFFMVLIVSRKSSSSSLNAASVDGHAETPPLSDQNLSSEQEYERPAKTADGEDVKPSAKVIADELVTALLERIGTGRGPVIEGGIGDSGTRGVRDVLKHLGAAMLDEQHVVPASKDSIIYMRAYDTISSKGKHAMKAPAGLYNLPIRSTRTLAYNESIVPFDHWQTGRQWVAKMIGKTMSVSQQMRGDGVKMDPWGFKHPRTALLVPFWHGTLGDKFTFIHVLRDGKDVVEGDNQKIFIDHCAPYYGRHCEDSLRQRLEFWADMNQDIFDYALQSKMRANQYIAVRIEDLVMGNAPCFRRLAQYIGVSDKDMEELVPKAIESNRGHMGSYFGHKWSAELKANVEKKALVDDVATKALKFWGYDTATYNFTLECEQLPWMKLMRRKKGALPGDL